MSSCITATLLATATVKERRYELRRFCGRFWAEETGVQVTSVFGPEQDAAEVLAARLSVSPDSFRVTPAPGAEP